MRVLFLTLCLLPQVSWAAFGTPVLRASSTQDDCVDRLLMSSSTFSSSMFGAIADVDLGPEARAYLRFLWAGYQNKFINIAQLTNVAMSITPVNPFREASENSLEAALQRAITTNITNMSVDQWSTITNEIKQALPALESKTQDRDKAVEDSSHLIGLFEPATHDLSQWAHSGTAWYEYNGAVYLAFTSNSHYLHVHKLDLATGDLVELDRFDGEEDMYAAPSWYVHEGRLYLAQGSSAQYFYLLELKLSTGKLIRRDVKTIGGVAIAASWYKHKDRVYLALPTVSGYVRIYELVNGQLFERDSVLIGDGLASEVSWQEHRGRLYLAFGWSDKYFYLYQFNFKTNKLIRRSKKKAGWVEAPPVWYVRDDHVYLLAGSRDHNLYLFELVVKSGRPQIVERDKLKNEGHIRSSPSLIAHQGHVYVAAISRRQLRLAEIDFAAGQFVELENYWPQYSLFSSPAWCEYNGRLFMAATGHVGNIYLFELDLTVRKLLTVGSWRTEGTIMSSPSWYKRDEQLYLVAGREYIRVFAMNKKIEGRGR